MVCVCIASRGEIMGLPVYILWSAETTPYCYSRELCRSLKNISITFIKKGSWFGISHWTRTAVSTLAGVWCQHRLSRREGKGEVGCICIVFYLRLVSGGPLNSTHSLIVLCWLWVPERVQYRVAMLTCDILSGTVWHCLRCGKQSSPTTLLDPLKLSTVDSRAFPVAAAKIWNALPDDVISASSIDSWLCQLKSLSCFSSDRSTSVDREAVFIIYATVKSHWLIQIYKYKLRFILYCSR